MKAAGPSTANILLDVREGSIREGAITGCTLQHSREPPTAPTSASWPWCRGAAKGGFFSIAANQISDTGVNIHLVHARGVNITGNTFFLGHQHNLLIEDCAQIVIGANLFDAIPIIHREATTACCLPIAVIAR